MNDLILIRGLRVSAVVGVPDSERVAPQELHLDIELETDFHAVDDDLSRATDYAAVAAWVTDECARVSPRLLETLATHLASGLLGAFPLVRAVTLEIRKFILPATAHVAVRIRRTRE